MSRFEKPRIRPKATDLGVYDLFENDSLFKNLKIVPTPPKWLKITTRAQNNMILGVQGGVGLIRSAKIAQKWTSKKSSNLKKSLIKWRKVYYIWYIIYNRYYISLIYLFLGCLGGSKTPSSDSFVRFGVKWPFFWTIFAFPWPPLTPLSLFSTSNNLV